MILGNSGLSIGIVGITSVAGLVSSEVLQDPKNTEQEIPADEAFEFFDVDGNGCIERGDLEYVSWSHVSKYWFDFVFRIFLNLAGIDNVDEIATQAKEILGEVDTNQDNSISRKEWRENWKCVQSLRDFKHKMAEDTLKAEMVAKYGKEGPKHIPLYAFGNKMSFYRLPAYPTLPEERPEGNTIRYPSCKSFTTIFD